MGWRRLGGEALTVGLVVAIVVAVPMAFGEPRPSARALAQVTLAFVAGRVALLTTAALWRRLRGPRPPRPPLPTGHYGE